MYSNNPGCVDCGALFGSQFELQRHEKHCSENDELPNKLVIYLIDSSLLSLTNLQILPPTTTKTAPCRQPNCTLHINATTPPSDPSLFSKIHTKIIIRTHRLVEKHSEIKN